MTVIRYVMCVALGLLLPLGAQAKTVLYAFDIAEKRVNFSGKEVTALTVDGSIPAPTIEAMVGDTLRVTFHNRMKVESSVHWHGILLPNAQDGVPYLTTPPIAAGGSLTYEYPVTHHGTYWYHSHSGLQEQRGVYGALVFHPKGGERYLADQEKVVVLSDWTDENPNEVLRNLKRSDDYYALKKDSVQSWDKVLAHGMPAVHNRVQGSWSRMGPMDISDVGYDAFLINGQRESVWQQAQAGETVRLRLINASASSYQYVEFAGGAMTIVAADGVDVQPKKVDRLKIAIAETYDVLVTLPKAAKSYELRATSEDVSGYASLWLGQGERVAARDVPKPNPFVMDHSMHHGGHKGHQMPMHASEPSDAPRMMTDYAGLRAVASTKPDPSRPQRTVPLRLTGDMESYVWSFNNTTLKDADKILIRKGETVRFELINETMMHHPIHLHGHFFRVLNGEGAFAPLKHTVNVPPMQTVTIEFLADEEKDWFFHCHNLYHMKTGMARVVRYENSFNPITGKAFDAQVAAHADPWYGFGELTAQTQMISGELKAETIHYEFLAEFEHDYDEAYEIEVLLERRLNRFAGLYAGGEFEREDAHEKPENVAVVGLHYLLPLLIEADMRMDSEGHVRLGLESELQLTDRTSFAWEVDSDEAYYLELGYELNKKASLIASFDSEFNAGAGIRWKF